MAKNLKDQIKSSAGTVALSVFFTIVLALIVLWWWEPPAEAGYVGFVMIMCGGVVSLITWLLKKSKKKGEMNEE